MRMQFKGLTRPDVATGHGSVSSNGGVDFVVLLLPADLQAYTLISRRHTLLNISF